MSVIFNQAQWAVKVLETYRHPEPLSLHLKRFYRNHKFMGSKDRRVIREMVYSYFRLGRTLTAKITVENILTSLFVLTGHEQAFRAVSPVPEIPHNRWEWLLRQYPEWSKNSLINFQNEIS